MCRHLSLFDILNEGRFFPQYWLQAFETLLPANRCMSPLNREAMSNHSSVHMHMNYML